MKTHLISSLVGSFGGFSEELNIPSVENLMRASRQVPLDWQPTFQILQGQSNESFQEQQQLFLHINNVFQQYVSPDGTLCKSYVIAGPPGVGKTYMLRLAAVKAISMGLNVTVTAVLGERAVVLGGRHLHFLFKIPVVDKSNTELLVQKTLVKLLANPVALEYLRRLDVLFVDEAGTLSAELLSTLDRVMRRIRESKIFMGGMLIISTIDPLQLPPIRGRPFLMFSHILPCFWFGGLKYSIRAQNDNGFQRLQELTRIYNPSRLELDEFCQLILQNCLFATSWEDPIIPSNALRVFGKCAATEVEQD